MCVCVCVCVCVCLSVCLCVCSTASGAVSRAVTARMVKFWTQTGRSVWSETPVPVWTCTQDNGSVPERPSRLQTPVTTGENHRDTAEITRLLSFRSCDSYVFDHIPAPVREGDSPAVNSRVQVCLFIIISVICVGY